MPEQRMPDQDYQIAIANLLTLPDEQPEGSKKYFERLEALRINMGNVEQAMGETRESLRQMTDNRNQMVGALNTILDLLKEEVPRDLIDKHGQELIKEEQKNKNGLSEAEAPKG